MSSIKQRIEEIKQEIQSLEFQLTLKKGVLRELEAVSGRKGRKSSQPRPPRKGSLVAYLVKVLSNYENPLPVAKIVEGLKEEGYSTDAKVGLNNLVPSACSKRPDLFFRARHGVYGLKGKHQQVNQGS